jgi:hypothetical protein
MGKKYPECYFRELRNKFFGLNIPIFSDADARFGIFLTLDPGSGKEKL